MTPVTHVVCERCGGAFMAVHEEARLASQMTAMTSLADGECAARQRVRAGNRRVSSVDYPR